MKSFFAAALATYASAAASDHWAVIVAGSNGYWNYRHQADTAHAVKIMLENGMPASNVIHMAYDDIANNSQNPLPGQLFNHPNGSNVYDASNINYSGRHVTPDNFLAVLTGDAKSAGGPVLESTTASRVFVYFTDHGAPGLIAFPSSYLYADQLQTAVDTMHSKGMYKELTFYIEACESGSMFPDLQTNTNVYAMTASNATQSSWASYCAPDDVVNGVEIGSCLGDLFSTNWMEDTQSHNPFRESLSTQHTNVKNLTTASPVEIFGDLSFMSEPVGNFEGDGDAASALDSYLGKLNDLFESKPAEKKSIVDSRDAKLNYLYKRVERNGGQQAHEELMEEITHRMTMDSLFASSFPNHKADEMVVQPADFDCLRFMMSSFEESCGTFSDYSLKYVKHLVHVCESETPMEIQAAADKLKATCTQM